MAQSLGFSNAYKIRDIVNVMDPAFGAKGDDSNDDTAEINLATATGKSVWIPNRTYRISDYIDIQDSFMDVYGDGATIKNTSNGKFFRVNDAAGALNDIGIHDLRLQCTGAAGGQYAFSLIDAIRVNISNIFVQDIDHLIMLGDQTGGSASVVHITHIHGWHQATGAIGFHLRACQGLIVEDVHTNVKDTVTAVSGAAIVVDRQNAATETLDSFSFEACHFQLYFRGLTTTAISAGNAQNFWFTDCIWDGIVNDCWLITTSGTGQMMRMFIDHCWMTANGGWGVLISGGSNVYDLHFADIFMLQVGQSAFDIAATAHDVTIKNSRLYNLNQLNTGKNGVVIRGEGCEVSGCRIGQDALGTGFKPVNAIQTVGDLLAYRITDNVLDFTTAGLTLAAHAAGSKNRLLRANNGAAETVAVVVPASTVAWTNLTGFVLEVHTIGGTVTGTSKNGSALAATASPVILKPADTITWTYAVAPTATAFVIS